MKVVILVTDVVETLVKNNQELVEQLTKVNKQNEQLHQEVTYLNELTSEMSRKLFGKSKEIVLKMDNYRCSKMILQTQLRLTMYSLK